MDHGSLIRRHPGNPILTAADWPYPIHSAFNPGATLLKDGRTLLLCRCEDHRGISHLTRAISEDGVSNWTIDDSPTFQADSARYPEEMWGVEDPRITHLEDEDAYVVAYTAFGTAGPGVALAKTTDFVKFQRLGLVMSPDDKDAALLPRKFHGNYLLIHRPMTTEGGDLWISQSPDLKTWGRPRAVLRSRRGAWWDANKIGLSPPPVETAEGWLCFYHGVRAHASGSLYRMGLALLDKHDPTIALLRGASWLMGPEAPYERIGDVPNVVFPCGLTVAPDNDTLRIYYGAADTTICLATASIRELLRWLHDHAEPVPQDLSLREGVENVP